MRPIIFILLMTSALLQTSLSYAAPHSACRSPDVANLEDSVGYGSSGPLAVLQQGDIYSLTAAWPISYSGTLIRNVAIRVNQDAPAMAEAQLLIKTDVGDLMTRYVKLDKSKNEYCFEVADLLGDRTKATPTNFSVRFRGRGGEDVSIRIYGFSYIRLRSDLLDYSVIDHLDFSDFRSPRILDFDRRADFGEYFLRSRSPLFDPAYMSFTLICKDLSRHLLSSEHLAQTTIGLKLNVLGLCTHNYQLEISSPYPYFVDDIWLLGKPICDRKRGHD